MIPCRLTFVQLKGSHSRRVHLNVCPMQMPALFYHIHDRPATLQASVPGICKLPWSTDPFPATPQGEDPAVARQRPGGEARAKVRVTHRGGPGPPRGGGHAAGGAPARLPAPARRLRGSRVVLVGARARGGVLPGDAVRPLLSPHPRDRVAAPRITSHPSHPWRGQTRLGLAWCAVGHSVPSVKRWVRFVDPDCSLRACPVAPGAYCNCCNARLRLCRVSALHPEVRPVISVGQVMPSCHKHSVGQCPRNPEQRTAWFQRRTGM